MHSAARRHDVVVAALAAAHVAYLALHLPSYFKLAAAGAVNAITPYVFVLSDALLLSGALLVLAGKSGRICLVLAVPVFLLGTALVWRLPLSPGFKLAYLSGLIPVVLGLWRPARGKGSPAHDAR